MYCYFIIWTKVDLINDMAKNPSVIIAEDIVG
jgi:hypothetical protein